MHRCCFYVRAASSSPEDLNPPSSDARPSRVLLATRARGAGTAEKVGRCFCVAEMRLHFVLEIMLMRALRPDGAMPLVHRSTLPFLQISRLPLLAQTGCSLSKAYSGQCLSKAHQGRCLSKAHSGRCLSSASVPKSRPVHLLLYQYVENAQELRQPFRNAHLSQAQLAVERGELLLGGALADPVDGGVLVFNGGADVAKSFAECDPYVKHGIVCHWDVRAWSLVVGSLLSHLPPPPQMMPSYEWQQVGMLELPAGLEVELPLDGQPKRARIPPRWRLQVWVNERYGYLRHDVQRDTTAGDLRRAAAVAAGVPPEVVRLRLGADPQPLADFLTVEALRLFGREGELTIEIEGKRDE